MIDGRVKEVIVDSRINKVLGMRTDSVAMLEALDSISEFYVSNTMEARRALRQDLELQNITLAKKFLIEFDQVKQRIENVEDHMNKLETTCNSLASRVSEADENMKLFMEKASTLENKRNTLSQQSLEIEAFLTQFQLSESEINVLHSAPIENPQNSKTFFEALIRLSDAYDDCKQMVQIHCYSAGFELLEVLGHHQDVAYQRLFDWVRAQCESASETASPAEDADALLQTAIRYLRQAPVYFSQCQDLVVNSRRSFLVQRFVSALTQGGAKGQSYRAIDLHAHDAARYVGDMLAWMHQAIASEEEFLSNVFGDVHARGKAADKAGDSKELNVGLCVPDLLARCLQGLGRPLRVRIMQTLESRAGLEALYALTDLLAFYETTFHKLVEHENAVHSAVKGCLQECKRLFLSLLNKQAEALVMSPSPCPMDLTATIATRECCKQINEVLRVNGEALSSLPGDKSDPCHVDSVLGCIIQPLLQACRLAGQTLTPGDMAIFMLNNVSSTQTILRDYLKKFELESSKHRSSESTTSGATHWISLLSTESETWLNVLVSEETSRTLRRSDMDKLFELIEVIPPDVPASQQPGLGSDRVNTIIRAFYSSLFSAVTPHFDRLQDVDLREVTRKRTATAIALVYEKVHSFLSDPRNGYNLEVLAHSVEEVQVLLGCNSL